MKKKVTSTSKLQSIASTDNSMEQPGIEPLALLFRQLMSSTSSDDQATWNMLLNKYVTDMRNAVPQNKKDMASARGNLQKELLKPEMTFNVFLKGLRFLEFNKVCFSVTGQRKDGVEHSGEWTVSLGDRIPISHWGTKIPDGSNDGNLNSNQGSGTINGE